MPLRLSFSDDFPDMISGSQRGQQSPGDLFGGDVSDVCLRSVKRLHICTLATHIRSYHEIARDALVFLLREPSRSNDYMGIGGSRALPANA